MRMKICTKNNIDDELAHLLDIQCAFKSKRKLRSELVRVKNKTQRDHVKGVVYSVECECGSKYVGETGRTLATQLKEHKRAVKMDDENCGTYE